MTLQAIKMIINDVQCQNHKVCKYINMITCMQFYNKCIYFILHNRGPAPSF